MKVRQLESPLHNGGSTPINKRFGQTGMQHSYGLRLGLHRLNTKMEFAMIYLREFLINLPH